MESNGVQSWWLRHVATEHIDKVIRIRICCRLPEALRILGNSLHN
jgi:hypothetical protein